MQSRIESGVTIITVPKAKKTNPHTGVYYHTINKNYTAAIYFAGKQWSLGSYDNVEDAIAIRKEAEAQVAAGTVQQWYENWKQSRK